MIEIKFDKEKNRAIALNEDVVIGECNFIEENNGWNIIHTEVDNVYQGQGIAKKLVECVKGNSNNKSLIADCSYAKKVLERL